MKQLTLIFTLNFILLEAESQSVFPTYNDNGEWKVLYCQMSSGCVTTTFSFSYDTSFCGHIYSVIDSLDYLTRGYFRSDSSKTYFRKSNNCSEKEYLIYDFSVSVGDTIWAASNILMYPQDTTQFLVNSIDTVSYNGILRKRIKVLYDPCLTGAGIYLPMYWIEGIGSDEHPFYPFYCLCNGCERDYFTLCYDSSSVQLYINGYYNTCDTTIETGIKDQNVIYQIELFPNPSNGIFNLKMNKPIDGVITIINSLGQCVYTIEKTTGTEVQINLVNKPKGIYFVSLKNRENNFITKIVIE